MFKTIPLLAAIVALAASTLAAQQPADDPVYSIPCAATESVLFDALSSVLSASGWSVSRTPTGALIAFATGPERSLAVPTLVRVTVSGSTARVTFCRPWEMLASGLTPRPVRAAIADPVLGHVRAHCR